MEGGGLGFFVLGEVGESEKRRFGDGGVRSLALPAYVGASGRRPNSASPTLQFSNSPILPAPNLRPLPAPNLRPLPAPNLRPLPAPNPLISPPMWARQAGAPTRLPPASNLLSFPPMWARQADAPTRLPPPASDSPILRPLPAQETKPQSLQSSHPQNLQFSNSPILPAPNLLISQSLLS